MKWEMKDCRRGDMIRIGFGQFYHYGIFVSEDEVIAFGLPPVGDLLTRNSADVKVLATDIDTFAAGKLVEVAAFDVLEKCRRFSPAKTISLARERIGEGGYNLIHNNCEHFAYECVFGIHKSTQEEEVRAKFRAKQG